MKSLIDKFKNNLRKSIFYIGLPLAIYSCAKDDLPEPVNDDSQPEPPIENVIETHYFNQNNSGEIESYDSQGNLTLSEPITNLSVGDYLSGDITEKAPNGFLRKVTGISSAGRIIQTSQAKPQEAIVSGEGSKAIQLRSDQIQSSSTKILNSNNSEIEFVNSFYEVIYDKDNNYSTTNDQVTLDGTLRFNVYTEVGLKVQDHILKKAELASTIIGNLELEVISGSEILSFQKEVNLGKINLHPFVISVGALPVVIKPEIEFHAGARGGINTSTRANVENDFSATFSVLYSNSQWTTTNNFENSFSSDFSSEGSLETRFFAGPKLNLLLYGVDGFYGKVEGYVEAEADIQENPWWTLTGGIDLKAGVGGRILPSYEKEILGLEKIIAQAEGPFQDNNTAPYAIFQVNPNYGTINTNFQFNASDSWDNEDSIEDLIFYWDFDDDGVLDLTTQNPISEHKYSSPGIYGVHLKVEDTGGLTGGITYNNLIEVSEENNSGIGGKIIFTSNEDGGYKLYKINGDGNGKEKLTSGWETDIDPFLLPDGSGFLFSSEKEVGRYEIFSKDFGSSPRTNLTNTYSSSESFPSISNDLSKIVYSSRSYGSQENNLEIFIKNLNTNYVDQLTNNSYSDNQPMISPDGTKIVFVSKSAGYNKIYIMDFDGSNAFPINLSEGGSSPSFSKDSRYVLFDSERSGDGSDIYRYDFQDESVINITQSPDHSEFEPYFTNEGILYSGFKDGAGNFDIYHVDFSGENRIQLTKTDYDERRPKWSE